MDIWHYKGQFTNKWLQLLQQGRIFLEPYVCKIQSFPYSVRCDTQGQIFCIKINSDKSHFGAGRTSLFFRLFQTTGNEQVSQLCIRLECQLRLIRPCKIIQIIDDSYIQQCTHKSDSIGVPLHTCHISHCEIKSHRIQPIWKPIPRRIFKSHRISR